MEKGRMQEATTSHSLNYGAEERRSQTAFFHSTRRAFAKKPGSSFRPSRIGQDQSFDERASIQAFLQTFNFHSFEG